MIALIWAMDENWLIGNDNRLPWHYPKDLQYFKEKTEGHIVLMGEQTYRSLKTYYKKKPLPFQTMVVANLETCHYEDATHVTDVVAYLKEHRDEPIMVIGGKTIYHLALPYADRLYITYVLKAYEGNVYFPPFDLSAFQLIDKRMEEQLIFAVYERKPTS